MARLRNAWSLYNALMDLLEHTLFRDHSYTDIFSLKWDYLIVLDACRYDVLSRVYKKFFDRHVGLKKIISPASSTMEFIRRYFSNKKILSRTKDIVFVNSNPVIDKTLQSIGVDPRKAFYKYYPLWDRFWDTELGTVRPETLYYASLKAFINHPNKKMVIWFLQPHYPYIGKEFQHLSRLGRNFMNKVLRTDAFDNAPLTLLRIMWSTISKGYLSAGIPREISEYARKHPRTIWKAYISNVIIVLKYVKKLAETLPGTIAVTADHGEALGEKLDKLIPVQAYGHPSRVKIKPLIHVPCLTITSNIPRSKAVRKAIKEILNMSILHKRITGAEDYK